MSSYWKSQKYQVSILDLYESKNYLCFRLCFIKFGQKRKDGENCVNVTRGGSRRYCPIREPWKYISHAFPNMLENICCSPFFSSVLLNTLVVRKQSIRNDLVESMNDTKFPPWTVCKNACGNLAAQNLFL